METRENARLRVKAWMSPPSHIVTVDTPVHEAFRRMRQHGIRHLLVMDRDRVVGVMSDRDLRRTDGEGDLWTLGAHYLLDRGLHARDVMSADPVTVEDETTTAEAARLMMERRIGCLPVVKNQACVGIVTTTDLLKALAYAADPDATWSFEMRETG
jgi:acetoin utilization protein AcuB